VPGCDMDRGALEFSASFREGIFVEDQGPLRLRMLSVTPLSHSLLFVVQMRGGLLSPLALSCPSMARDSGRKGSAIAAVRKGSLPVVAR
jgi:hypothetical protein